MERVIIVSTLVCVMSITAFAETHHVIDYEKIRAIVKEEISESEKRTREYIDVKVDGVEKTLTAKINGVEETLTAKIESVEKQVANTRWFMGGLIALIIVGITAPWYVVSRQDNKNKQLTEHRERIEQLERQMQTLQEEHTLNS